MTKVFFIGIGKTGTTSAAQALRSVGCHVHHSPRFGAATHLKKPDWHYFDQYDYFLDGAFHNYLHLQKWFPKARFVLLERNDAEWLMSMYSWLTQVDQRNMKEDRFLVRVSNVFMRSGVFQNILTTWLVYQKRVHAHFQNNPRFIAVNLTSGEPEEWNRLASFLEIPIKPEHANIQSKPNIPVWIEEKVQKARFKSAEISTIYPEIQFFNLRDRLFLLAMRVLYRDFIHERHLAKNLKSTLRQYPFWSIRCYGHASLHLLKFTRMVGCLLLRMVCTRDYRLSPFIF